MVLEKVARLRQDPEIVGELVHAVDHETVEPGVFVRIKRPCFYSPPSKCALEIADDGRPGRVGDEDTSEHPSICRRACDSGSPRPEKSSSAAAHRSSACA